MKFLHFSAVTVIGSLAVACGGADAAGDKTQDQTAGDPTGETECDPEAEIPCFEGLAEPCPGIESGFPGDEYCRAAPDPALGMQVHVGPKDYDDPEQIAQYVIAAGDETNWAEEVQFPNPTPVYTRGYRSYMRPGSHHFIMFGNNQRTTEGGPVQSGTGAESAVGVGGRFLGGATKAIQNIDTQGEFPEDQGIGSEVPANSFVAMNLHFVNATPGPLLQEIWVNFIYIDEADVTQYVKPITWYGGLGMNIPPGTHTVLANNPGSCTTAEDLRIGMMTAHAHASTLRVTTWMNGSTLLFEDYDWAEPTEWRFNRSVDNPAPNPQTMQSGGHSGLVYASPGDSFVWECEVRNERSVNLTFSNRVYDGEMCNVFGFYITDNRTAAPWTCAFF
jgi:hypothetical protein